MESLVVAGLDIGSSKITAIIAQKNESNEVVVLGVGVSKSLGIRRGNLVNIEKTSECIAKAIEKAEIMSGIEINSVYLGLSGNHIQGCNEKGIIAISNKDQEVGLEELKRVIDAAQTIHIPNERKIVHVIPWEFRVDEQTAIRDPIGMKGVRLEADVHIITASAREIHNINKSLELYGLKLESLMLSSIASSEAVLSYSEKENGVLLIDMGCGTSDAVLFIDGSIRYSKVFPFAGQHITQDISITFRISEDNAENLKKEIGACLSSILKEEKEVEVFMGHNQNPKKILNTEMAKIIEARVEEIFYLVYQDLSKKNLLPLISSLVLTGGTSLLPGMQELSEKIFQMPSRIAFPEKDLSGIVDKVKSPEFSTAVGLIIHGLHKKKEDYETLSYKNSNLPLLKRIQYQVKKFFKDFLD